MIDRQQLTFILALAAITPLLARAGTPDLAGPWQIVASPVTLKTIDGQPPPLKPEAQAIYDRYAAERGEGDTGFDPITRCLPPGVPRLAMQPMPFKIEVGKRAVAIVYQWNHLYRLAYLNQPHFPQIAPQYLGQSTAKWLGDTLVIDSDQFNDSSLLDDSGLPHSAELHTVESYSLGVDSNQLRLRVTIDDPRTYSRPWSAELLFRKKPGYIITEDYCLRRAGKLPALQ